MPRSDFATSAEYHADADRRAVDLLNGQIARIDAALSFMRLRKAAFLPSICEGLERQLLSKRARRESFLLTPACGSVAVGLCGAKGDGPALDQLIRSVDFHANQRRAA